MCIRDRGSSRDARLDSLTMAPPRIRVTASPGWEVLTPAARMRLRAAAESDPFLERVLGDGRLALGGIRSARPRRGAPARPGFLDARVEAPASPGWVLVARHPSGALTFHAASAIAGGAHRFELRLAPPPFDRRESRCRPPRLLPAGRRSGGRGPAAGSRARLGEETLRRGSHPARPRAALGRGGKARRLAHWEALFPAGEGEGPALSPRHVLARVRGVLRPRAGWWLRSALETL